MIKFYLLSIIFNFLALFMAAKNISNTIKNQPNILLESRNNDDKKDYKKYIAYIIISLPFVNLISLIVFCFISISDEETIIQLIKKED